MHRKNAFRNLWHPVMEHRIMLSLGLSLACGIVLQSLYPIHTADPMLRLIALERPAIFHALVWSSNLFLYSTPFFGISILFSLVYVHLYKGQLEHAAGALPPCPDPHSRRDLSLVVGEIHRQLVPEPSPNPHWLILPERGLYTGIAVFGSIGSEGIASKYPPEARPGLQSAQVCNRL